MVRFALLILSATLYVTTAQAHGSHQHCAVGDTFMGVVPHYHSGGNAPAASCDQGRTLDPTYGGDGRYRQRGGRGPMGPRDCGPGMNSDGYRCVPIGYGGRGPMGPRNCGPGMNSDGYRCVQIGRAHV